MASILSVGRLPRPGASGRRGRRSWPGSPGSPSSSWGRGAGCRSTEYRTEEESRGWGLIDRAPPATLPELDIGVAGQGGVEVELLHRAVGRAYYTEYITQVQEPNRLVHRVHYTGAGTTLPSPPSTLHRFRYNTA